MDNDHQPAREGGRCALDILRHMRTHVLKANKIDYFGFRPLTFVRKSSTLSPFVILPKSL